MKLGYARGGQLGLAGERRFWLVPPMEQLTLAGEECFWPVALEGGLGLAGKLSWQVAVGRVASARGKAPRAEFEQPLPTPLVRRCQKILDVLSNTEVERQRKIRKAPSTAEARRGRDDC